MYNISQFKPALYALLLLGMLGFALAAQSPAVLVLGCGGVTLNAWLVRTGRFRPLSRVWANGLTLASLAVVGRQLFGAGPHAVVVIGQFLVALQLVKVWEQRANRDFAQLLVLSLLEMVAAAISTASLLFGVMLLAYLFLSLYCCLLFHLKVETDAAKAAMVLPEEKVSPAVLRQDQRFLARSMRRLTGVVSAVALALAVVVFVFFPRGSGQSLLPGMQFASSLRATGFNEEISLNDVTRLTQNTTVVAHVQVWENGQPSGGAGPLRLRGLALDHYRNDGGRWHWTRAHRPGAARAAAKDVAEVVQSPEPAAAFRQKVLLQPTGGRTLFAVAGPAAVTFRRDLRFRYDSDGVLVSEDAINQPLEYEVTSTGTPPEEEWPLWRVGPEIPPPIQAYALRPEVSGADADGPLAARRLATRRPFGPHPLDGQIAFNIEQHLRGPAFHYTLDTSDANRPPEQDPYVWFLSDAGKRGHCEYFAGAMALMCKSLGMRARVVVGYRCDEYNGTPGAGYYIVRESHAHAWVEVLTDKGWETYDPTNAREADPTRARPGLFTKVKHVLDLLEFSYATAVIGYDSESRDNLIQSVESRMTAPLYKGINSNLFARRGDGSAASAAKRLANSLPAVGITLASLAGAAGCGWFLWQRWRLRRRAARIGLDALPPGERERLARQLGFYDDLIRLLGRHRITRPPHQTPREFSRSLLFLPGDAYQAIGRLTGIFYRVRFGGAELSPGSQRRLGTVIGRLEAALAGGT